MSGMERTNEASQNTETVLKTINPLEPTDVLVGTRVRLRRIATGMSEEELGGIIGVAVTRMVAYERGEKRIGAVLLYHISVALDCSPTFFFEEM
jgi:DNA-binding XRE family transcriptional regulator